MTTKAKKPTAKTEKPAGAANLPPRRKQGLLKRAPCWRCSKPKGATIETIVSRLGVSNISARSLINDCRRAGAKVERKEEEGKPTTFVAA